MNKANSFNVLRLISGNEKIMIEALDGQATIANAKNIFKSFIDTDFKNWGLNNPSSATGETLLDIHEMVRDATFNQMFNSLNTDLDKLVMTQAQIIRFCEKHPTWFRQGGLGTFFLIKENSEYFVVLVGVYSDGLLVNVYRFGYDYVWRAEYRPRLVVPQRPFN